ncbi:polyphenol oxidase, chloroplastic-like [Apium graveolens]|uniref:polyphenol oxidase, chloroplastic-like n=1 Tax=Apium graveolens TaxID=4045 RepID=UPI003D79EBC4
MASFPLPTSTATTISAASATAFSSSSSPFLARPSQLTVTKRYSYHGLIKFTCKATNGDENSKDTSKNNASRFDRRDLLIGLGGLYGATSLTSNPSASASPLKAPDLSKCGEADLPAGAAHTNCCPPFSGKVVDYKLPVPPSTMRVRPAAHLADKAYQAKFKKALELMKALPDSDPRSFTQQANIHCAYCDGAYEQVGFPELDIQVHNSWLFFPFHRWYLYFFERILGSLIDDPTFAIPFWNWDSSGGMPMASMYTDRSSPLYDRFRDAKHSTSGFMVDLDYNGRDENITKDQQANQNLTIMYRQMVSGSKSASLFLGSPLRAGESEQGGGNFESVPHGPVHIWSGDRTQPNLENMGNFYSAGRDPMFYAHHANCDRMWSVWKTLGGNRRDYTDRDWLDSEFVFYDEKSQLVRVKVGDSLDSKKLGYVYQDVPLAWTGSRPTPRLKRVLNKLKKSDVANAAEFPMVKDVFPIKLDKVVKVLVHRPKKNRTKKEKENEEEILVIEGIEVERDAFVKFDVFINDEDEAASAADKTEFAGSFVNVPHKHKHGKNIKTRLRLALTDLLEDLGAEDDDNVLVTLVPKPGSTGAVKIKSMKIVLDD